VEVNCKVCHEPTQDDGYGELVHADTGLYGDYVDGYRVHELTHVAV
jgi:hypothetical protein